jgi:hypothetical protein
LSCLLAPEVDHSSEPEMRIRGSILADDMGQREASSLPIALIVLLGLGKTLTAIAVLWAYLKGGKAKGLIICPSSLVENWEKEVWLADSLSLDID